MTPVAHTRPSCSAGFAAATPRFIHHSGGALPVPTCSAAQELAQGLTADKACVAQMLRDAALAHPYLIDLGAGNCAKAARLIPHLQPCQYVPVDISVDFLKDAATRLQQQFPALDIVGVCTDFSAGLALPDAGQTHDRVFFYPGSSRATSSPTRAGRFQRSPALARPQRLVYRVLGHCVKRRIQALHQQGRGLAEVTTQPRSSCSASVKKLGDGSRQAVNYLARRCL